jgi:hypothetical protein
VVHPYRGFELADPSLLCAAAGRDFLAAKRAYSRRVARVIAGTVGVGGSGLALLFVVCEGLDFPVPDALDAVAGVLLCSAALSILAYTTARAAARFHAPHSPRVMQRDAVSLEYSSVLLPLLALSFLLPLPLLLPFFLGPIWRSFAGTLCLLCFGPVHLVLLVGCVRYAGVLHNTSSDVLLLRGDRDWARVLVFSIVGVMPGLFYVFLLAGPLQFPGSLVGFVLAPTLLAVRSMFNRMRASVVEERATLRRASV